jgi:branched-chain amino acid transport system substrate-binding protein
MYLPRLIFAAATLAMGLAGTPALAQDAVKIGVLTDMTGPYADLAGPGSVEAAKLAIEDFGGSVLGKKVELVVGDHTHKPDVGVGVARQWYERDGVDMIIDVANSAVALGVTELAKDKHKIAIFSSAATERLTEDMCNNYAMHWSSDTYSQTAGGVKSAIKLGYDTWFIMAGNYEFGHSMQAAMEEAIKQNGGKVVGSLRFPVGTLDFSSFLLQAQASKAKMINIIAGGTDMITAVKQANEFGLVDKNHRLSNPVVYLSDVHGAGLAQMAGMQVVVPFYWDYDERTRAFGKRFFAAMKKMPTEPQGGVYSGVLQYLKAVQAAGSKDADKVVAQMRKMPIDDMFSRHGKLLPNGRMIHDMYLAEVKSPAESKAPWDYYKILSVIPADQAFRPLADSKCPLLAARK